jgi:hypothetical protein
MAKCQSPLADPSAREARKAAVRRAIGLGPLYAGCSSEIGRTLMQMDLFLVWVALLGAVSFIALSFAD